VSQFQTKVVRGLHIASLLGGKRPHILPHPERSGGRSNIHEYRSLNALLPG